MKLSVDPYKGTRDFYPQDMRLFNYFFDKISDVLSLYGYEEYTAPIVEQTDLYVAKSGQEIVEEQTYSFVDRGGRNLTIRPEMTPSLARMVARKFHDLVFPIRWFSIPQLYRYEKPQRGRLREHYQLNVDLFGITSPEAELELVTIGNHLLTSLGATQEHFKILVNSRRLVSLLYQELQLSPTEQYNISKLLDRKNKLSQDAYEASLKEILPKNVSVSQFESYFSGHPWQDFLKGLPPKLQKSLAVQEIELFFKQALEQGIHSCVFDITLMRGFDYYTGIVFEFFDTHPENKRALFGGGRYDDLVGIFNGPSVTGCGFGMGDVTLRDFLDSHNLLPVLPSHLMNVIIPLDHSGKPLAQKLASLLRAKNESTIIDTSEKKLGQRITLATKKNAEFVYIIGEDEIKTNSAMKKNLKKHTQDVIKIAI